MSLVDVAVVIPTHNRRLMLEEALNSVLAQSFDGTIRIIVVDDCSQDDTADVIRQRYPQVNLIPLPHNVGAYAARNRAIELTNSRYVAFLDSDDLWEPDYLTIQIDALAGHDRSFCVSDVVIWRVDTKQKEVNQQQPNVQRYGSAFHHLLVGGSFICTPSSVVFPSTLFMEVGQFNESLRIAGDTDFYLRCFLAGYAPIYTKQSLVIWREHGNQLTHRKNDGLRMQERLIRAQEYYPLIAKQEAIVSLQQIQAEIYLTFAGKHCANHAFGQWLRLALQSARYFSWLYTLQQMIRQIKRLLMRDLIEKLIFRKTIFLEKIRV
ncbi:glycosyltransferase family 2 protein [Thermocoleostomius sinensis]|uniref:Glycosyltransferase n=1 Tax=Thermocoleostomius sinensis A174 TaxID=2016057 RepID=A0A9E9CAN4_9CYAN|nr:glycosyltransferase [Thermocoleostomius sinensis]WAL59165.1 glycosyltransferase [Thermocoleostomius sinensis A174]